METFLEFIDRKGREAKKQLEIVAKLLESQGLKVARFLDDEDPYIFLRNTGKKVSFEGVRVYKIGSQMAYRVQKAEKTHPYGKAYSLDLEEMFNDFLADKLENEKAGKMVMKTVAEELQKFFKASASAEEELMTGDFGGDDPMGKIVIKSTGTDYSNLVHAKA
jgi:hypothetical protein